MGIFRVLYSILSYISTCISPPTTKKRISTCVPSIHLYIRPFHTSLCVPSIHLYMRRPFHWRRHCLVHVSTKILRPTSSFFRRETEVCEGDCFLSIVGIEMTSTWVYLLEGLAPTYSSAAADTVRADTCTELPASGSEHYPQMMILSEWPLLRIIHELHSQENDSPAKDWRL